LDGICSRLWDFVIVLFLPCDILNSLGKKPGQEKVEGEEIEPQ
jgi:hypothetical protein